MENFTALVNLGSAGAVIGVVIIFINYIKSKDEQTIAAIERLTKAIQEMQVFEVKHHEYVTGNLKDIRDCVRRNADTRERTTDK